MNLTEPIGDLASALVLAAFCMRDMVALRWLAIASNLAFIAYGALAGLGPVLLLHLLLLPVNALRLAGSLRKRLEARSAPKKWVPRRQKHVAATLFSQPAPA